MKSDEKKENTFQNILQEEANKIGVTLTPVMLQRLEIYKNMLLAWNEKMNLTAITDEYEIIIKHFIDCIMITKYIEPNSRVIDVGTGAGFPGIVIAIFYDQQINITLLDSLNKRLLFLQEVVDTLQLKNVTIIHGRAEEIAHKSEFREQYDVVVSRAVANLPVLLEYTTAYVKPGGICLYMKADSVDQELKSASNAIKTLRVDLHNKYSYTLTVSQENFTRNILFMIKQGSTPNKYPRNYGKIKKQPL